MIVKKAFTMIELVFVIVIMGIVASIGAEIIAKLYENYISTRSINKLQFQTDLVLNQIAKRLSYRIRDSVIAQEDNVSHVALSDVNPIYEYPIIAWIGKSNESFLGEHNGTVLVPGWSGFVDLYSSDTNETQIKTSGSHLSYAKNIIEALSYNKIDINSTISTDSNATLIFKGKDDYNVSKYGWIRSDANYTYNIRMNGNDILEFSKNASTAYEQYDLAWSAYALVPEPFGSDDFNLTLYYNFQPWDGETYSDGESSVIMEHVSTFKFIQIGETIRIKLCIRDESTGNDFGFCKEKVVF